MESLGPPIGKRNTALSDRFDQGEYGTGIGLSGGADAQHAYNSQSGGIAGGNDGFNAGLGGKHASGGLPSSHPIADKYMTTPALAFDNASGGGAGGTLDNSLDDYGGGASMGATGGDYGGAATGVGAGYGGAPSGQAVSGAYEGGPSGDALTGQSYAQTIGSGGQYDGDNLPTTQDGSSGLGGTAAGATTGAALGAGGAGVYGAQAAGSGAQGQGITGPSGGAGGHYSSSNTGATGTGGRAGTGGDGTGAKGRYGTVDDDPTRGQPVADPKELDSGGRHGLVFDKSTGTYEHRHMLGKDSR